jgi:hypothetical protein|tara:strand:+ start:701 stop:910 length:210 start_codon:yes stop_codon:yes gene_type:complete
MKALLNRNGSYYVIAPGEDGIFVLSGRFVGLPLSLEDGMKAIEPEAPKEKPKKKATAKKATKKKTTKKK